MNNDATPAQAETSAFYREHAARLAATAQIGPALDLACGRGRHAIAAATQGLCVLALDRNHETLAELAKKASLLPGEIAIREADLENEPLPSLETESFGAILVFRYLHRPLCGWIETLLAPGGILIYETFTTDQRTLGWGPRRDEFLLRPGELPKLFPHLRVETFEEGLSKDDKPAETARLLASKFR